MSDDAKTKAKESLLRDLDRERNKLILEQGKNSLQISRLSKTQKEIKKKIKLINDTVYFLKNNS